MSYSRKLSSSTVILYFLLRLCYNAPSLWNGIPVEIQLRSFTGILCKSTESLPFLPEHILPNHLGFSASLEKILHCCTTSVLCTPPYWLVLLPWQYQRNGTGSHLNIRSWQAIWRIRSQLKTYLAYPPPQSSSPGLCLLAYKHFAQFRTVPFLIPWHYRILINFALYKCFYYYSIILEFVERD